MRLVIQRVKHASVEIDGAIHGKINQGYMILVGIQNEDTREIVEKMAEKVAKLRIFTDEEDKMNLNLSQIDGSILSISQLGHFLLRGLSLYMQTVIKEIVLLFHMLVNQRLQNLYTCISMNI